MLLIIILSFILFNIIFFTIKIFKLFLVNIKLLTTIPADIEAISFHTYKPKNSIVPLRGQIIAKYTYKIAYRLNIPIILSVGNTVPNEPRTESEIYKDYIKSLPNYDERIQIITSNNPQAEDTESEVATTFQQCLKNYYRNIGVVALLPHLVLRIIPYWQKINLNQQIQIHFDGILGPQKYIFWELAMLVLEFYIPPNSWRRKLLFSWRRKLLLNLANRSKD